MSLTVGPTSTLTLKYYFISTLLHRTVSRLSYNYRTIHLKLTIMADRLTMNLHKLIFANYTNAYIS